RLAIETLVDGCIGETSAAVLAHEAASRCEPGPLKSTLETIAEDEARHAELAWRILAWAISTAGSRLWERLIEARRAYEAGEVDAPMACGVLTADEAGAIRARVISEVIDPCLHALTRSHEDELPKA